MYDADFVKKFTDLPLIVRTDNLKRLRASELFANYKPGLSPDGASFKEQGLKPDDRISVWFSGSKKLLSMKMKASSIIDPSGWLSTAKQRLSPNHDERPKNTEISLLVIHHISLPPGKFGGHAIEDFFMNRLDITQDPYFEIIQPLKVSSHLLIRRAGELIQFVPFVKRAWHAGESSFAGKEHCNDFSIGIELEGTDDKPYETVQYTQLAKIIVLLKQRYPNITDERVVGHVDIAPGRKTDPGSAFDWQYLRGISR